MGRPRIQVLLDGVGLTPSVRGALRRLGACVRLSPFSGRKPGANHQPVDARLIVTADAESFANGKHHKLLDWVDSDPCATLVLATTPFDPEIVNEAADSTRPLCFATGLTQEDLAGRLTAMCGLRASMNAMRRELDTLKVRDETRRADIRRLDDDLRLAALVQRDLLPNSLPEIDGLEIQTVYQPAGVLSGDIYDVTRLDDHNVAFSLVDATGHGPAAALLSAFAKRALRDRSVVYDDDSGGPTGPGLVLARLNREMLESRLQECHFVTVIYAVYNEPTREIRWARGGGCYPVLVPKGGSARQLISDGPLVGVCEGARFEVVRLQLHPDDTLLFHTDGLDSLLLDPGTELGCCQLDRTPWFNSLGHQPLATQLGQIERRFADAKGGQGRIDDTTILALRACSSVPGWSDESDRQASPALCCVAG